MKRVYNFLRSKTVFVSIFITDLVSNLDLKLPNNWYNIFNISKVWLGTISSYLYGVDEEAKLEYDKTKLGVETNLNNNVKELVKRKEEIDF